MGTQTKVAATDIVVVQSGTATLTWAAGDTSKSVDIYAYRTASSYDINLTVSAGSPRFSYKQGYGVFDTTTGLFTWGIRALFDVADSFGTDSNGNQVYALLRIFFERKDTTAPSASGTFNIDYYFTNQQIPTS